MNLIGQISLWKIQKINITVESNNKLLKMDKKYAVQYICENLVFSQKLCEKKKIIKYLGEICFQPYMDC